MQQSSCRVIAGLLTGLFILVETSAVPIASASDPMRLPTRPGRKDITIWPPRDDAKERASSNRLTLDGWQYTAVRSYDVHSGVPWELQVTPSVENPDGWILGDSNGGLPSVVDASVVPRFSVRSNPSGATSNRKPEDLTLPTIRMPEMAWRKQLTTDFNDVIGIHFHEFVSNDYARILYTLHKVPPDGPDGKPPANFQGGRGTRIEATLLTPVVWSLDQSVVVRDDWQTIPDKSLRDVTTQNRIDHEVGHAEVSRSILVPALAGPQDWNPQYCTGRRGRLAWYWRREMIARSWDGYKRGVGKLKTLRTSVAIVPPSRWSKLLPIPPERITQRHIDEFNREIVEIGPLLSALDQQAQSEFHAHHGAFEGTEFP